MLAAQPPFSGDRRSHQKPLQPKNQPNSTTNHSQPKTRMKVSVQDSSNKENLHPSYLSTGTKEIVDPSLADELKAIREKLERLRAEEVKSEKMLRERGMVLDLEMKEILERGEVQKQLELEVDRLYRLKEIKLACMRTSRLRSLRDKEDEKKMKQDQLNKAHGYIQGNEIMNLEAV